LKSLRMEIRIADVLRLHDQARNSNSCASLGTIPTARLTALRPRVERRRRQGMNQFQFVHLAEHGAPASEQEQVSPPSIRFPLRSVSFRSGWNCWNVGVGRDCSSSYWHRIQLYIEPLRRSSVFADAPGKHEAALGLAAQRKRSTHAQVRSDGKFHAADLRTERGAEPVECVEPLACRPSAARLSGTGPGRDT